MDVAQAIDAESISVTRKAVTLASGAYDAAGKWVPTNPADTTIRATVQPARGRQLMDLPEGVRNEAEYFIWTRSTITNGDVIGHAGGTWRVLYTWPRPTDGFNRAAMGKLA